MVKPQKRATIAKSKVSAKDFFLETVNWKVKPIICGNSTNSYIEVILIHPHHGARNLLIDIDDIGEIGNKEVALSIHLLSVL